MGKSWERFVEWMRSSQRAKPVFILCGLLMAVLFLFTAVVLINTGTGKGGEFLIRAREDSAGSEKALEALSTSLEKSAATRLQGRSAADSQGTEGGLEERKIIYNAGLTLETKDPDGVYAFIMEYMKEQGGYVASARRWVDRDERLHIQMRLRLPAPSLEDALATFGGFGEIVEQSLTGSDVTEQYYDLEARLKNKKSQEERYLEILQGAKSVDEILQVERELERIRGEIESMEGRFRYLQDQTDLATLNLLCREPSGLGTGIFRPGELFQEIAGVFLNSLRLLVLVVTGGLPWLLIAGLALFAVFVGRKKRNRRE